VSRPRADGLVPTTEICGDLVVGRPPLDEIARQLGYPHAATPRGAIAARLEAVVEEALPALRPRGAFAVHRVTAQSPRRIVVGDAAILGDAARFVGAVDRVGVVVATAGEEITELAEHYRGDGDALAEWIAEAIGSWAAEAAADRVTDRLRLGVGPGEAVSLRYSPGYCGMAMNQQRVLFGLVDARAVGVTLLPSLLMRPLKSVSGIVGIGPAGEGGGVSPSPPCDNCDRIDCHMRR
jgi:hypothetical protein